MTFSFLDVGLLLAFVGYAWTGYRRGLLTSVLSLGGFLVGGAVAMLLLPHLVGSWPALADAQVLRSVVLVLGVFALASIGQTLASRVGSHLRTGLRFGPAQLVDSVLGAAVVVASVAVLVWFVAGALRGGAPAPVTKAIGESRVLRVIDAVVPPQTSRLFAGFRQVLDREGLPRVFDSLRAEPIRPVEPPDPNVARTQGVVDAAGSIVKITGVAQSCHQGQEGTGWVVSPGRVVTNAHVVAGIKRATVRVRGTGRSYTGQVVVFDPQRDLAVLFVPNLPAEPLPLGSDLERGDGGVVAGFPLDGPYRLDAARVRQVLNARGADIYGKPGTLRQVYSLYARVQPGNSGGPLLSTEGEVVGVIFAKSLDDDFTGYALTLDEAAPVLRAAAGATARVGTGGCLSR